MDGDYRIDSMDFSLLSISAVAVVRHTLKASRKMGQDSTDSKTAEEEAAERVAKSNWPRRIKVLVGNLIKPISDEIDSFKFGADPIFTPQGTVNAKASMKAVIMDQAASYGNRHAAACMLVYCELTYRHVQGVDKYALGRNDVRWIEAYDAFIYWVSACRVLPITSKTDIVKSCVHLILSWHDFTQGSNAELLEKLDTMADHIVVAEYPEKLSRFYKNQSKWFPMCGSPRMLSPAMHVSLFSKLGESQQLENPWVRYAHLLESMLHWPYQRLFLNAARILIPHLNAGSFWWIILSITYKLARKYEDYDYRGLFDAFWDMGADCRKVDVIKDSYCFGSLLNEYWCDDESFRSILLLVLRIRRRLCKKIPEFIQQLKLAMYQKYSFLAP